MTLESIAGRAGNDASTRRLLEMMFQQTRMAMCVTDPYQPDNPIVAINAAFTRLTGYGEDEILGRNCRFLQGPETDPDEIARIRRAIEDRSLDYFELLNYRKDGTAFWNALHVGPILDEAGRLLFHFGSQWDVTEKVETVRALEGKVRLTDERLQGAIDEAYRLRAAVDQAGEAMILTEYAPLDDPGPRIVWVNRGFERMSGYAAAEVIGHTPRMFQGPATERSALDTVRAALERGEELVADRAINYKRDGTPFHVEWSIVPVARPDGEPGYWLSVQRDITERVEDERKLRLLTEELNHRHKNVLAVVAAVQNMLPTQGLTAAEYREALDARMQALTAAHDVLFAGEGETAPAGDVAATVLAPFANERLRMDLDDATIAARPASNLALILHELATNAAKHGALSVPEGQVNLRLRGANGAIAIDWSERDGPPVTPPERPGFGHRLLRGMAASCERDDAGLLFDPAGVRYRSAIDRV